MHVSLQRGELLGFVGTQLDHFYPDGQGILSGGDVDAALDEALQRTEHCFSHIAEPGYARDGQATFNHLHSDQYAQFLYYLGNSLWRREGDPAVCSKLSLLNKTLNGLWCSYKLALPDIFYLDHPVGTVLGHAKYSDFLVVMQCVTINTAEGLDIGEGVLFASGSQIIGNKPIGARCSISSNTTVYDVAIPSDSVAFLGPSGLEFKRRNGQCAAQQFFTDSFS